MKRILISLDLDGTILNQKSRLPFFTKKYLQRCIKKGHVILLNTGRPFTGALPIYKEIGLYSLPIAVNNGRAIVTLDANGNLTVLEEHLIPRDVILSFFDEIKEGLQNCFALDLHGHYFYRPSVPSFIHFFHRPEFIQVGDLHDILPEKGVLTFTCYIHSAYKETFLQIAEKYTSILQLENFGHRDGGLHSYHFSCKGFGKATAIQSMEALYSINHKNTFAYGDSSNDIDMLAYAEHGVAMKNARESVLREAKNITKHSNNHHGVIRDFIHRKRKIK